MSLAKPHGLLTSGFDLVGDDVLLATMEGSFWREGGNVRVGDHVWELRRQGWSSFRLVRDNVDEAVARSVGEILTAGREAVAATKALIGDVWNRTAEDASRVTAQAIATRRTSPEGQEGLRAFLERRKAAWTR